MSGLAPKLRFKQDNGADFSEWEELPFGEAVTRGTQDKGRRNRPNLWVVDLEHLEAGTGRVLSKSSAENSLSQKNEFSSGDILFGKLRPYLKKFAKPNFDGVCSSEIWVLSGIKVLNEYLFYIIQTSYFNQLANISSGSKMPRSDWGTIADSEFSFPSLFEQQKIADFLSSIDAKIDAVKRKLDAFERYKKGLMQQIFSQKIRFKQDDGSDFPGWEEKRLGDVYSWIKTNSLSREYLTDEINKIQNIHYGDIHTKFKTMFHQEKETIPYILPSAPMRQISNEEFCQIGDVIIADASEDYKDIGKSIEIISVQKNSLVAGLHTYIARPNKKTIAIGFSGYLFANYQTRKQIMRIAQGISVLGVSKTNVAGLKLNLPSLPEQQKIADFLSSVDLKIDAIKSQTEKLEAFKKGLLQQMFV